MNKYLSFVNTQRQAGVQETLALVLDASPSMDSPDYPPSRFDAAKAAAYALIDEKARQSPQDLICVVSFAADAEVIHPPANVASEANSLKDAIGSMTTRSATNITAGIRAAADLMGDSMGHAPGILGRMSQILFDTTGNGPSGAMTCRMIILSDGEHNRGPNPASCAKHVRASGVTIATIGIGGRPDIVHEDQLKRIASTDPKTGEPLYCFIADTESLIREFKRLANCIRRATSS